MVIFLKILRAQEFEIDTKSSVFLYLPYLPPRGLFQSNQRKKQLSSDVPVLSTVWEEVREL